VWRDPVTDEALPPPKDMKSKSLLQKVDPDLLAHFEAMASDPYGHVQKLRDEEAARQVIDATVYGEDQHNAAVNPFLGQSETAKGNFVKSVQPGVVEFFRYEARPVDLPLFGSQRNMTVEARLSKDPSMTALLDLSRSIHRQWSAEDMASAEAARKTAEETLKRLEANAA
jgi:hypothetical protein